ncbi:hypothetical protein [Bradyrhizobium sp. Mp27]|uniref:hypothetical protein n=1 Tax=Bradyrhizobium sp. Mp27 TaxID=3042157 RepID=UPI00248B4D38|nr:hypothetical protein [Bradyrhizobium sp. Mp27]MDI2077106.1 hypothetical protein [Bradyrhizobium sp. Mp27]
MIETTEERAPHQAEKHLVILVHGINTNAQWFPTIKTSLEAAGFIAAPAGYGIYGVLRFLIPKNRLRRAAIDRVYGHFRTARKLYKPDKISVIAHSFGTYVVSKIIEENFDIDLHRIIFCGSVVKSDFPFQNNLHRFTAPLYNEIGTRDFWPLVASTVTWGYGSVGSDGFQNPVVSDRWHKDFQHSDFLTKEFCEKFYIPSLRGEKVAGDAPIPFPFWAQLIGRLPVRWLLAVGILTVALLACSVAIKNAPSASQIKTFAVSFFMKAPPPPPPPIIWQQLAAGSRFTPAKGPVMAYANVDGPELNWKIDPGQIVPPSKAGDRWELASVSGVEWLRLPLPSGEFAYVPRSQMKPVKD